MNLSLLILTALILPMSFPAFAQIKNKTFNFQCRTEKPKYEFPPFFELDFNGRGETKYTFGTELTLSPQTDGSYFGRTSSFGAKIIPNSKWTVIEVQEFNYGHGNTPVNVQVCDQVIEGPGCFTTDKGSFCTGERVIYKMELKKDHYVWKGNDIKDIRKTLDGRIVHFGGVEPTSTEKTLRINCYYEVCLNEWHKYSFSPRKVDRGLKKYIVGFSKRGFLISEDYPDNIWVAPTVTLDQKLKVRHLEKTHCDDLSLNQKRKIFENAAKETEAQCLKAYNVNMCKSELEEISNEDQACLLQGHTYGLVHLGE